MLQAIRTTDYLLAAMPVLAGTASEKPYFRSMEQSERSSFIIMDGFVPANSPFCRRFAILIHAKIMQPVISSRSDV